VTYVQASDFRPGSGKWYTHGIPLSEDDADSNALSDAITAMSEAFDLYTFDHFSPEPGDGPPEGTITLDVSGSGGPNLTVPKRIRSITDVSLRDREGVLTSQDVAVYRVTQSLVNGARTEGDLDSISVIPGKYLTGTGWWGDSTYPGNWSYWPVGTNSVQLTGTFSWENTPEQVKRAVSLMVYDAIKPSTDTLHRADRWATPNANFTVATPNPTGLPEVDGIISQFTRDRIPAI
jgi:hypothetical protein